MEPELELKLCSSMAAEALVPSPANTGRRQELERMVRLLEEELPKIEAIKHHLPYSASIVTEAFEILKKKLEQSANENHMATEELLPIKIKLMQAMAKREKEKQDNSKEKVNLSLCMGGHNYVEGSSKNPITTNKFIAQESKEYKSAFVPYKSPAAVTVPTEMTPVTMHNLSMSYPGIKMGAPISSSGAQWSLEPQELHSQREQWSLQTQELRCQRKARRCWSEDIHNKFVLALEQLGGPIEATPRKIREVMNVDGLTNDEVKSHLQKYRMRARNESSSSAHGNQPLVSGSFGVPKDHYPPYSPQGPLQLVGPTPTVSLTGGDSFEVDGNSESYS